MKIYVVMCSSMDHTECWGAYLSPEKAYFVIEESKKEYPDMHWWIEEFIDEA